VAAATSPSSLKKARPPPKKARSRNFLPSSVRYVRDGESCLEEGGGVNRQSNLKLT
jgi:hypothetical protein